ncbi:MAG TPA: XRE family transcriptional regulator [Acetobacteraceae bacterium]|nr:XRE family transcriptional regulator [Acetobacteraceae bacterium]
MSDFRPDHAIAQTLGMLRKSRGWTLKTLSEATGVSISALSKIENGQAGVSFETVRRILRSLSLRFDDLVGGEPGRSGHGRRAVNRRGSGTRVKADGRSYELFATDLLRRRMIPMITTVHARTLAEWGALASHPGEEWMYVLSGAVALHTEHYAPLRLEAGDSIYIDAEMAHGLVSLCEEPAEVLSVVAGDVPFPPDANGAA